jgi:hypothetical protein
MRSINRRLAKLEERCGMGPETEEERRSRERFAELKRRFDAIGRTGGPRPEDPDALKPEDLAGLSLVQILNQRFRYARKPVNGIEGDATGRKDTRPPDVR